MKKSKLTLDALQRAEKRGTRIVIDASEWHGKDRRICPILPDVSPTRCDLVTETRRLVNILENRPKAPPEGVVYGLATDRLETAVTLALAYIGQHMKGLDDAKSNANSAKATEQADADGDDDADTGDQSDGDAGGAVRDRGRSKKH